MARTKTEHLDFRVTPEQKERLLERAKKSRLSMTDYLLALSEQKKIVVIDDVSEIIKQILKIGTNVNQIAMVANTNKNVSEKQLIIVNDSLSKLQDILAELVYQIKNEKDEIDV